MPHSDCKELATEYTQKEMRKIFKYFTITYQLNSKEELMQEMKNNKNNEPHRPQIHTK